MFHLFKRNCSIFFSNSQLFTFSNTTGSLSITRLYIRSVIRYLFNVNSFAAPAFTSLIRSYFSSNEKRRLSVFPTLCKHITSPTYWTIHYKFTGHWPLSCYTTARLSHSAKVPPALPSDSSPKISADRHAKSSYIKSRLECIHFFAMSTGLPMGLDGLILCLLILICIRSPESFLLRTIKSRKR